MSITDVHVHLHTYNLEQGIEFFDIENDFEYRTFLEKETEKNAKDCSCHAYLL